MSDPAPDSALDPTRRRIRAQASVQDANAMAFVLDAPVQEGAKGPLDPEGDAPLARALFAIDGVERVEVAGESIWIGKDEAHDWAALKPAIAAAVRDVLGATDQPLGAPTKEDPDTALLSAVQGLLEREINPAIAAHGGHIAAERVSENSVYLRMSGGCQGCAASSATLRDGVERMLRAALPQIEGIVDVTDHDAGTSPFYARSDGPSPVSSPAFNRPLPPGTLSWQDGQVVVDPEYLAPRLGLTPEGLREGLRSGDVVGVTESGEGTHAGKARVVLRSATRAWAAEIDADGAAREVPPPRVTDDAARSERELARRVRAHLEGLAPTDIPVTYGALARGLGLWAPGSINRVTRALEHTMREDAAAGRPFIAARAVSRGRDGLPGGGFFALARALSRGPAEGESDAAFHRREMARLLQSAA